MDNFHTIKGANIFKTCTRKKPSHQEYENPAQCNSVQILTVCITEIK